MNPIKQNLTTIQEQLLNVLHAERALQVAREEGRAKIHAALSQYNKHGGDYTIRIGQYILTIEEEWFEFSDVLDAVQLGPAPKTIKQVIRQAEEESQDA